MRDARSAGCALSRDHRIKTDGGFALRQVAPGSFEWETPSGHRYAIVPGTDAPSERMPGVRHSYAHIEARDRPATDELG